MSPKSHIQVIVHRAGPGQEVPIRGNPRITKVVIFENFAGGHYVGESIATHPPGEACGLHNHRGAVERFYILDGFAVITVGDQQYQVGPGDSVLVPPGVMHNVAASPHAPLKVLCSLVVAPGSEGDPAPWLSTQA